MVTLNRISIASVAAGLLTVLLALSLSPEKTAFAQYEGMTCAGVQQPSSSGGQNWQCCDNTTWFDANIESCCYGSKYNFTTDACCMYGQEVYDPDTQGCCMTAIPADAIFDKATEKCCMMAAKVIAMDQCCCGDVVFDCPCQNN